MDTKEKTSWRNRRNLTDTSINLKYVEPTFKKRLEKINLDRKLKIIPEPKPNTRTVFVGKVLPLIKGVGNLNLLCGNCNAKLIEGIDEGQIRNIVIQCPICKLYNEIP
jgi:hypothetical protein